MNQGRYKVSKEEWQGFQEHYAWQLLTSPDYRLGQAFLNYFPEVSSAIVKDKEGTLLEMKLYYETDNERAKWLINQWLDQ